MNTGPPTQSSSTSRLLLSEEILQFVIDARLSSLHQALQPMITLDNSGMSCGWQLRDLSEGFFEYFGVVSIPLCALGCAGPGRGIVKAV